MNIFVPEKINRFEKDLSNFGLRFQKFFPYSGSNLQTEGSVDLLASSWKSINQTDITRLLKQKHDRQDNFLKQTFKLSAGILKIHATLASRLITGIGETTPVEVGMVFDRNIGIPYIPASSIKGAVAYGYAVNAINGQNESSRDVTAEFCTTDAGFTALFGSRDSQTSEKGGFCFLDAYPISMPQIEVDIMSPHFSSYYQGNKPPSETDNPTPIKFLTVEKGAGFIFRGFFVKKAAEKYKKVLIEAFRTTLEMTGIGAKTSIGYGLFESFSLKTDIEQEVQNDLETRERELDEKNSLKLKEERLAALKAEQEEAARLKEKKEKAYQEKLSTAEGIEKDILLLESGDQDTAYQCYEKYLKDKQVLTDPAETKLAELVSKAFQHISKITGKKAKKDKKGAKKYSKKLHVENLLSNSGNR